MAVKVNPDIEEYIDGLDCDEKIKKCLKDLLNLELKRYKEDLSQYSKDYNRIVETYLEKG